MTADSYAVIGLALLLLGFAAGLLINLNNFITHRRSKPGDDPLGQKDHIGAKMETKAEEVLTYKEWMARRPTSRDGHVGTEYFKAAERAVRADYSDIEAAWVAFANNPDLLKAEMRHHDDFQDTEPGPVSLVHRRGDCITPVIVYTGAGHVELELVQKGQFYSSRSADWQWPDGQPMQKYSRLNLCCKDCGASLQLTPRDLQPALEKLGDSIAREERMEYIKRFRPKRWQLDDYDHLGY